MRKFKNLHFLFLFIFPISFELQRCTIPHFKALDKLFWPLAWVLNVGAITFVLLRKMSVYFFSWHTLIIELINILKVLYNFAHFKKIVCLCYNFNHNQYWRILNIFESHNFAILLTIQKVILSKRHKKWWPRVSGA